MGNKNKYRGIFTLRYLLFICSVVITMLILSCFFGKEDWYPWITGIIASVVTSILVGAFYEFIQKEQISEEHLSIMEYLNEKNSSGIIKYYGNFIESTKEISSEVSESQKIDIYLTYGYTILNTLSHQISFALSKKDTEVNIYLMSDDNPFSKSYSKFWFNEDNNNKFKQKSEETLRLLKGKYNELRKNNSLNGEFNVYMNKKSPVNYSFYLFDDKLFFVPSKNTQSKEFSPVCILAQKTSVDNALYNKVNKELETQKSNNVFDLIKLDEE